MQTSRLTRNRHADAQPLMPGRSRWVDGGDTVFGQGDVADSVFYVVEGWVQLSMLSVTGRNAIVARTGPGGFLGEAALLASSLRAHTATAITGCRLVEIGARDLPRLIRVNPEVASHFIAHMLRRIDRLDADLADQLFNSAKQRLARALLLLAAPSPTGASCRAHVSQEALSDMIGTTRSRVNVFLRSFRALGLIEYNAAGLTVTPALQTVCGATATPSIRKAVTQPRPNPDLRSTCGRQTEGPSFRDQVRQHATAPPR